MNKHNMFMFTPATPYEGDCSDLHVITIPRRVEG